MGIIPTGVRAARKYVVIENCQRCGQLIPDRRRRLRACVCSLTCQKASVRAEYHVLNPRNRTLSPGTAGALAELAVATDLMAKGYEVFRALSPSCSCDLVVLAGDRIVRVEVKTGYRLKTGKLSCSTKNTAERHDVLAVHVPHEQSIEYRPGIDEITRSVPVAV